MKSPKFTGWSEFHDDPDRAPTDGSRIVVVAAVEDSPVEVEWIVDTAAPWNVLDPAIAEAVGLLNRPSDRTLGLVVRGRIWDGIVVRGRLTLIAEEGDHLELQGSFFVPELDPDESWPHPNFLGYTGALERCRFAVDPAANRFWFAPLA